MGYRLTPLLLLSLLCGFAYCKVEVTVEGEKLELEKTNEDLGPEYRLKREPITLTCTATGEDDLKLKWGVNINDRIDISDTEEEPHGDKKRYKSTLTISEPVDEDITNYSCTAMKEEEWKGNASGTFRLPPLITLTVNSKVADDYTPDSGKPTEIKCEIRAHPQPVSVRWEKELNGELKQLESTEPILKLNDLNYDKDRAIFSCRANNTMGYNSAKLFLRVRNPWAFLIPLVAIIVEIALILIIVIAYEISMRKKRAAAGDDTKTD